MTSLNSRTRHLSSMQTTNGPTLSSVSSASEKYHHSAFIMSPFRTA